MKLPWLAAIGTAVAVFTATPVFAQDPSESDGQDYNEIPHTPENCSDIRVFSARGSNEPYPGRGGAMLGVMCQLFEAAGVSCDYEDVVYPANISYSGYFCESAHIGTTAGPAQMAAYVDRCPDSRLVLMGYSQGASVVGDILGGGGGPIFGCEQAYNPPLSRDTAPGSSSKSSTHFSPNPVLSTNTIPFSRRGRHLRRSSLHDRPTVQHRTRIGLQWHRIPGRPTARRPQRVRGYPRHVVQLW